MAKRLDGSRRKLALGLRLGPGHIVLDGTQLPLPQRGMHSSPFLAHICCGHMPRWITMALGREVGIDPGHIVLDRDQPPRGHSPQFSAHVCSCCGKRLNRSRYHALGTSEGLGSDHIVFGDPAPPIQKGGTAPPFGPFIVAKRLDGSRCAPVGTEAGLGASHIVLHRDPGPHPQKRGNRP